MMYFIAVSHLSESERKKYQRKQRKAQAKAQAKAEQERGKGECVGVTADHVNVM